VARAGLAVGEPTRLGQRAAPGLPARAWQAASGQQARGLWQPESGPEGPVTWSAPARATWLSARALPCPPRRSWSLPPEWSTGYGEPAGDQTNDRSSTATSAERPPRPKEKTSSFFTPFKRPNDRNRFREMRWQARPWATAWNSSRSKLTEILPIVHAESTSAADRYPKGTSRRNDAANVTDYILGCKQFSRKMDSCR
jgi:hypothetical protein